MLKGLSEFVYANPFPVPTIAERVESHLEEHTESLYICPDAWALRHRFINQQTGEVIRARCDSWRCLYCGPRKVDLWRQVIREAQPVLMVTLTRAGKTVEEAARALTTWVQAMRRGSSGKGATKEGARPAYPIEYLAVLERHSNFEEVGFHWHLLIKGVDFLPKKQVEAVWKSATHGVSWVCWVNRVNRGHAVGYVTKYLTKDITRKEQGSKVKRLEGTAIRVDEQGKIVEERKVCEIEVKSYARRIRYSQGFFPESVKEIRARLLSRSDQNGEIEQDEDQHRTMGQAHVIHDRDEEARDEPLQPSSPWRLFEVAPFTGSVQEYQYRKRLVLEETLVERQERGARLNRRVLGIWNYQRDERYKRAA